MGSVFSVWLRIRQGKPKKLECRIYEGKNILDIERPVRARLSVLFEGQSLEVPNIYELKISNIGNKDINKADFEGEIKIDFGFGSIKGANIVGPESQIRAFDPKIGEHTLSIPPFTLNKDCHIIIKIISDGYLNNDATIHGIIMNGRILKRITGRYMYFTKHNVVFFFGTINGLVVTTIIQSIEYSVRGAIAIVVMMGLSLALTFWAERVSGRLER